MFYNARWYDPSLGRFAQADSIIPGGVQGLDRYAYVNNSPVMYADPSGNTPQNCNIWGWCWEIGANGFTITLTADVASISANVYMNGQRIASQFIDDRNNLCGAVTVAAILRTQSPSYTGNQIINVLDKANINTDWTGRGDIADMARHFGWQAVTADAGGKALKLAGNSGQRFNTLLGYVKQGWIPVIAMQTNGGIIGSTGGTPHWVGVVGIGSNDDGRFINIYNPIDDSVTEYAWNTFYESLSIGWTAQGVTYTHNALALIRPPNPRPVIERWRVPRNGQNTPI